MINGLKDRLLNISSSAKKIILISASAVLALTVAVCSICICAKQIVIVYGDGSEKELTTFKRYVGEVLESEKIALGTNDFLQYNTIAAPKSEKPTPQGVLDGFIKVSEKLKAQGKKLIVFNVLNFGECIDSRPEKEAMVTEFNKLLEANKHHFHAVYDQASLCVNPEKPTCSRLDLLGKDKIHPNKIGGGIVADNVDMNWFR